MLDLSLNPFIGWWKSNSCTETNISAKRGRSAVETFDRLQ
jgi:hypothetical protein